MLRTCWTGCTYLNGVVLLCLGPVSVGASLESEFFRSNLNLVWLTDPVWAEEKRRALPPPPTPVDEVEERLLLVLLLLLFLHGPTIGALAGSVF